VPIVSKERRDCDNLGSTVTYRKRFAVVYACLAAVAVAATVGAFVGSARLQPPGPSRCHASGPDIAAALYSAAYCQVGRKNVAQVGWMPHIEPTGYPSRTLDEVAIVDFRGVSTFWLAEVRIEPHASHVAGLTRCGDVC
jgi:hypothetical protein